MDENSFKKLANQELSYIAEAIEFQDRDYLLDHEYQDGILTITLPSGGQYVINRHLPSQQIWLSSPISSASYFAHDPQLGQFNTTANVNLRKLLANELQNIVTLSFD